MNDPLHRSHLPAILILGMHRSGTSCLAGSLQEAGLYLGEVNTAAPHNAKGNRESRAIMELHDDLLRANGGAWDAPPEPVVWPAEYQARRDAIIATYPTDQIWGFKDPRTLLTLEGWLEALPSVRFVGTFRHPLAVAASLQARNGFAVEHSLALWEAYNRLLLDYQRRFGFPILCFDWLPEHYHQCLRKITPRLGLTVPETGLTFFEAALRRNPAALDDGHLPPSVAALHRALHKVANRCLPSSWLSRWRSRIATSFRPAQSLPAAAPTPRTPHLSIIVVVYNMRREAPRTLYSLSPAYQLGVSGDDYEVIVVDNGSTEPLSPGEVAAFGAHFRYVRIEKASPSPAGAINHGVALSKAPFIGIMIDGARMATPGVIALAMQCLGGFERAVVGTVGFHLGPEVQMQSVEQGYNATVEDELLTGIDWRNQGYRLFEIGALAGSSSKGWLGALNESNLIFLPRTLFDELEGFDERFSLPGGGFVNLDFYRRACELPNSLLITLLGEATFHQMHGGAVTNQPAAELPQRLRTYGEDYQRIRGFYHETPTRPPLLFGHARPEMIPWLHQGCHLESGSRSSAGIVPQPKGTILPVIAAPDAPLDGLQPGDQHYRAYVGRVENYDVVSALQFSLLTLLGLREYHQLLDVGCGSLRGGRLFIPYLLPGHYFGIEPNAWLIREGIAHEIGADLIALKQPRFAHNEDFNLAVFDTRFDFILAQSIFSHAGPTQIRHGLASARRALKPGGLLVATFGERLADEAVDEWVYPGLNFYRWSSLAGFCAEAGWHCRKLDWPHPQQTWFAAAIDLRRLEAIAETGVDFLPDELVLTDRRVQERDAGHRPGFYRVGRTPEARRA
jgi:SAM-dependent methyltransferase